ncbi:MAG: dihydrolipoamide acetyltransferase family protein, partial [Gemmatimonadota bacterium]|nr:dihydrolipoamide acetyltransferase family protein [Gemmatimonadota bacterium]
MGESIAEGTLTTWLKQKGDTVERDENLFEISTDKVDAEIPSPASGTLGEILVEEGETVEVGTVVARLYEEGEEPSEGAKESGEAEEEQAAETPSGEAETVEVEEAERGDAREPEPAMAGAAETEEPSGNGDGRPSGIPTKEELRRTRSSPLVRNIAAEHGVEISEVEGTGLSGRVTKDDILAYVEEREKAPAPPERPAEREREPAERVEPAAAAVAQEGPKPFTDSERVEIEPMSVMRQKISDHMMESKRTSAHVTSFFEIDMTRVAELRKRNREDFLEESGVKLTYLPFIIKALVAGVKEYPVLNASVWEDKIVYKKDVNVGIAVALPEADTTGFGLIVPVVRKADELSLVGLARSVNDLAERARTKRLKPEEVQGGTITITNPGVFGSLAGTPIINQPQVAILGVGAIEKRVKVVGPDDAIGVRTCAYFSISYDHRVVDGATADHFMLVVKERLESFSDPSLNE